MSQDDFAHPFDWTGPTFDPNDEHFGDVVENATLADAENYTRSSSANRTTAARSASEGQRWAQKDSGRDSPKPRPAI